MSVRNPELSRRVAQALDGVDLSFADRAIIAAVVHRADTAADLPDWLRQLLARYGMNV